MEQLNESKQYSVHRIGNLLHKVFPIVDNAGRVVQLVTRPLMVELKRRDIMQILIGASILSIPVGFTGEVWQLGEQLPTLNIVVLGLASIAFIALFVYFNFYRELLRPYWFEFVKRVFAIYLLSGLVVAALLSVIQVAPWGVDNLLALKRVVIVTFPASMSAALSDALQ